MPFYLPMPSSLEADWSIKIYDKERLEPAHVTILRGKSKWRWCLRTKQFMDDRPRAREVPRKVVQLLKKNHRLLCQEWDKIHPANPVHGDEDDSDR